VHPSGNSPVAAKKKDWPSSEFCRIPLRQRRIRAAVCRFGAGQRLDWWRSGLFNDLFFSAVMFLEASLVRHFRSPILYTRADAHIFV
jgi:hypothetical protein